MRAKLDGKNGKRFWKNLDELAETPAFHEMLEAEFPRCEAGRRVGRMRSRRGVPQGDGRVACAGRACGMHQAAGRADLPLREAARGPHPRQADVLCHGFPFPTGAIPVLVKSDAFRPIKVDGNPDHPMSKGKSDAFTQATLLDLYDPDRSQGGALARADAASGRISSRRFSSAVKKSSGGAGIYFLSETMTSPTLAAQWKQVQAKYPQAKLVQWEPVNRDSSRAASKAAFGSYMDAQYRLENADVILSLDADFLGGIAQPGISAHGAAYAQSGIATKQASR